MSSSERMTWEISIMNHRTFLGEPPYIHRGDFAGNTDFRKQIRGACFRKSQRSRREAEARFFQLYGTPPTHLKVKFRGGRSLLLDTHADYK